VKTIAFLCLALSALEASAAPGDGAVRTVQSSSGQFLVRGSVLSGSSAGFASMAGAVMTTNSPVIDLEPNLLAISCERIKQALLRELAIADLWRGRVQIAINPAMASNQPPVIGAKVYTDGWRYQVELPPQIHKLKLVRGIVQVLLMEIANRNAGLRSAEIPLWLSEGMSQQLLNNSDTGLVFSQPKGIGDTLGSSWSNREGIRGDPLKNARQRLSSHAALTFAKLGDPLPDQLPEETWKTYQACSHLFVNQLLALNGGRAGLLEMLYLLPHYLNWQSAFLTAYQPVFPRLLDVEKWWAVVLVNFTGQDPQNAWAKDLALQKLDDALHPFVLVSTTRNDLPHRAQMSLQEIINQWDYLRQHIQLKQIAGQLTVMRVKMPPEMLSLVTDYLGTIDGYLKRRDQAGISRALPGMAPLQADAIVKETIRRLNELDRQRAAFGSPAPKSSSAPVKPSS
jgi:hypothetical protein